MEPIEHLGWRIELTEKPHRVAKHSAALIAPGGDVVPLGMNCQTAAQVLELARREIEQRKRTLKETRYAKHTGTKRRNQSHRNPDRIAH